MRLALHIGTWGLDLLGVYERLKGRTVYVHLSDFDGEEHRRLSRATCSWRSCYNVWRGTLVQAL